MGKAGAHWQIYERIVAAIEADKALLDVSVTRNVKLMGRYSNTLRQIDVLLDARWDESHVRRIIVDAKRRNRPLNVKEVEAFLGMVDDCGADYGILYSPKGYSEAAQNRAREKLQLITLDDEQVSQDRFIFEKCEYCNERPPHRDGMILWDGNHVLPLENDSGSIVFSGKCDRCLKFWIWCWGCGEKFLLKAFEIHQCGCGFDWVELERQDTDDSPIIRYALLMNNGKLLVLDRLPLS